MKRMFYFNIVKAFYFFITIIIIAFSIRLLGVSFDEWIIVSFGLFVAILAGLLFPARKRRRKTK